ncbi:gamma-tubulin complex component 5-like [Ptychodera flava]|uniref:gamma-tubulin complex component 5-like n=1 Tax=Ptychodera flava TaxID=63121 RepID=UPI003969C6D0
MAYLDKKVDKDTRRLIKHLTGFEEDSENFQTSVQFALSNFRFHRFLNVDSHKLDRTIDGVCEKFAVHSQPEKKEAFKKLTDSFLNSPLSSGESHTKTDVHYGLLSLLLNLSDSPVNHSFQERQATPKQEKDEFDWGKYLLEGIEIPRYYHYSSDEDWSDDEATSQQPANDTGIKDAQPEEVPRALELAGSPLHSGKEWIAQNVMVQYWHGEVEKGMWSSYPASNIGRKWEKHLYETQPFFQLGTKTMMTEAQIVRETIWLFCGATDGFVYKLQDGRIRCNPEIQVSHLTPNALYSLLNQFVRFGQMMYHLRGFIEDTICSPGSHQDSDHRMSQTMQAFASSMSKFLQREFQTQLCKIEKQVMEQEQSVTLIELKERLFCELEQVSALHEIYEMGVVDSNGNAAVLLTTMYDKILLLQTNTMEAVDKRKVCLILGLFIQSIRPYLEIIDGWISNGTLTDPANEFIISRNKEVKTESCDFWEKGYTFHSIPAEQQDTESKDQQVSAPSQQEVQDVEVGIPGFLEPILYKIVLGGKSMDLLDSLRRLTGTAVEKSQDRTPMFDQFVSSMCELWKLDNAISQVESQDEDDSTVVSLVSMATDSSKLLQQNAMMQSKKYDIKPKRSEPDGLYHKLLAVFQERPLDIQVAMYRCLYPHIDTKCTRSSRQLVELLKSQHKLLDYLAAVRGYFLMEAGDTMYDFYTEVFEKLRLQEHWQDVTYLNLALQEALQAHHAEDIDRLRVSVEPVGRTGRLLINALDGLTLHYKVPWPIDVVLNDRCQRIYNEIFSLLLQVKRAKYCLDQLRFTDLLSTLHAEPTPTQSANAHRVQLLRVHLMHFVNVLHNYIMTRILHSTGLEFQQQLTTATDLNQVIEVHNNYIKTIYERCLVNRKMGYVREAIIKVLNLTLNCQKRWDAGVNAITEQSLESMEEEFKKCNYFLSKLFANAVKRGAFPHLEMLAQSLLSTAENEDAYKQK